MTGDGRKLTTPMPSMAELILRAGVASPNLPASIPASASVQLGKLRHDVPPETSPAGQRLLALAETARANGLAMPEARRAAYTPLTFPAYKRAIAKMDSIQRAIHQNNFLPEESPELVRFGAELFNPDIHTPDFRGYLQYLGTVNEALGFAILREVGEATPVLREELRRMHSLVIGGSGAGKSELLKLLLHHYVRHPELGAVLLLDPHDKLAREVARWREFSGSGAGRLVYLDGSARPGLVPALNPLAAGSVAPDDIPTLAAQLGRAVALLSEEGEGVTGNMLRLARFCVWLLLERPGSTFLDFIRLLRATSDADPLLRAGLRHRDELVRGFFEGSFQGSSLDAAKDGLVRRIEGALLAPAFRRMMTAPRPFDLQGALEAGKVVTVNVASAGSGDVALGRLLMAQVAALGERRIHNPQLPRTPVHVFVDEATKLTAPPVFKILKELRKVGIHLTMALQVLGDGMEAHDARHIVQNTEIKLVGKNRSMGQAFKALGWDTREGLPWLNTGQFIAEWGNDGQRIHLEAATHLLDDSNAMHPDAWQAVLERQLEAHHRAEAAPAAEPAATREWARE